MIFGGIKLYKKWEEHHEKKKAEKGEQEHPAQQPHGASTTKS